MMIRRFKPGDRVRHRNGGPVMTVQRYTRKFNPVLGWYRAPQTVECTWYDSSGIRTRKVHQHCLIPFRKRKHPLYTDA